ncbi:MAG: ABC transporter permease [Bacteroidota bacterium]
MIKFLLKGLWRDKSRSLLPVMVVASGVFLVVLFHSWISGIMEQSIEYNARFSSGHVKIMTTAYAENLHQKPNDLALLGVEDLREELDSMFPEMVWAERIIFGGLVDLPDENGETRAQGPAMGYGIDLLSGNSAEIERFNIPGSLQSGSIPEKPGEILISDEFMHKLDAKIGDELTLIGSTMYGEMTFYNFTIAGTVKFGAAAMDKGSIIADIKDVRMALNMENAAGEILGYFGSGYFEPELAVNVINRFNTEFYEDDKPFSPIMISLRDQDDLGMMVDMAGKMGGILTFIFIVAMSIVLWNAGILGGLRRYSEFGVRLAIGEEKGHLYKTIVYESLLIGIAGSLLGTLIGLSLSYYLQNKGIDVGDMMKNATIMMPSVFKAKVTPVTYVIGFIPGVISTTFGSMMAGIAIYKRKTARLFKELET